MSAPRVPPTPAAPARLPILDGHNDALLALVRDPDHIIDTNLEAVHVVGAR